MFRFRARSVKLGLMERHTDILCPTCGKLLGQGVAPRIETQRLRLWCRFCRANKEIVRQPTLLREKAQENVPHVDLAQLFKKSLAARYPPKG
jgi:hypothetical protein